MASAPGDLALDLASQATAWLSEKRRLTLVTAVAAVRQGRLLLVVIVAVYVIGVLTGTTFGRPASCNPVRYNSQPGGDLGNVPFFSDHPREGVGIDIHSGSEAVSDTIGDRAAASAIQATGGAASAHEESEVSSKPPAAPRKTPPRKPIAVVGPPAPLKCSVLAVLRRKFIRYLTVGKPAVMNVIGQMDAEVLLPAIADLMPHDNGVFMIDIGANLGQTSGAMMAFICGGNCTTRSPCAGKKGTGVIAFEPQRRVFNKLNAAARAGRWALCGWQSRNAAVSATTGTMSLFGGNTHASLDKKASWMERPDFGEQKVEEVEVTTVDDVVADFGLKSIFLLKIDTEGFDTYVVQGASRTLQNQVPRFVLAEYNTKWFQANSRSSLEKFVARMWRFGYLCYVFTPNNFVPLTGHWWAPELEFKRWSNIFCGVYGDPALELLLRRVNWIYAPPMARCVGEFPSGRGGNEGPKSGDEEGDRSVDWDGPENGGTAMQLARQKEAQRRSR